MDHGSLQDVRRGLQGLVPRRQTEAFFYMCGGVGHSEADDGGLRADLRQALGQERVCDSQAQSGSARQGAGYLAGRRARRCPTAAPPWTA